MKIVVLGNEGSWYVEQLARAADARGHACRRAEFRELAAEVAGPSAPILAGQTDLATADAVIVRTMPPGSLEQVVFRMDVLQRLQRQGVLVFNPPRAIECAVDKYLATARLAAAGLPTPRTIVCETAEAACAAFERLGRDVVIKPLFGAEGRGILRVSDPDLAERAFKTLERLDAVLYVQEYVPHAGSDIRVLVLNGRVLGAIRRSHPSDFRTNVSRQGTAHPHSPTEEECLLALQAAQTLEACFAGVDLLYHPAAGCLVIEVNAVPGWKAFQRVTGIDVAEAVMHYLEEQS